MNTNLFIASLLASSTVEGTYNFTASAGAGVDSSDSELVETNQYIGPSLPPFTPRLSGAIVTPKTLTHLLHENPNCAAAATAAHEEDDTTTTFVRCCLLPLFCLLLREREEPLPYYTR